MGDFSRMLAESYTVTGAGTWRTSVGARVAVTVTVRSVRVESAFRSCASAGELKAGARTSATASSRIEGVVGMVKPACAQQPLQCGLYAVDLSAFLYVTTTGARRRL
ncbi:MAG: hypothetical protein IPF47_13565 [Gemmatimonadetes bacterium]|nr:hypothetical protein [Gemmatimonadota bacterium]